MKTEKIPVHKVHEDENAVESLAEELQALELEEQALRRMEEEEKLRQ